MQPRPPDPRAQILLARMDSGLYTLQQACLVAGTLWALGDPGLRKRLLQVGTGRRLSRLP